MDKQKTTPITMNIVGCGRLGKPVARKLVDCEIVAIGGVVNQTLASGQKAAGFLGSGSAYKNAGDLPPAEVTMIACGDDQITAVCDNLVAIGAIRPETIVFHCSGAYSSTILAAASTAGAHTGSLHPMKSFTDAERSFATLEGTFCGIEGDPQCSTFLETAAKQIGMKPFVLKPESKILYHAGAVTMCNYLVALLEAGFQCFEAAGVDRKTATAITKPFIEETLKNVYQSGTVAALTGPIARGDAELVTEQYSEVNDHDLLLGAMYSSLGELALQLSQKQGSATKESLAEIEMALASVSK